MATPKTISQRIALEGAEEIKRLLEQIGQAGERAMQQLGVATSAATKHLEGMSKAVATVQAEVGKIAEAGRSFGAALGGAGGALNNLGSAAGTVATRVTAFTALVAAATAGVTAFGVSAIKVADSLGETAASVGLSATAYQGWQFAAAKAGVEGEKFAQSVAKFSKQVVDSATEESKALLKFAEGVTKPINQAGVVVVGFGRKFADEFKVIGEAATAVQEKLKAQGIEVPLFRIREALQKMADGGAASRKEFEDLVGKALPAMNEGLEQLRTKADGSGNALRRLGIATRDVTGKVRPIEDVLGDVAEKFAELPEGAQRTALALELFGRGGAKMGSFLAQGRKGIQETIKELERLGILLSKEEVEAADKAADAMDLLGLAATNLKTKLGLVFADPIREGASSLTTFLTANAGTLQQFARDIESRVTPIVKDFIRVLSGKDAEVENKWILTARDRIVEFGRAVEGAVLKIVVPAFELLLGVLQKAADGINKLFGTSFTGGQIGIAVVLAQMVGLFGLFTAAIGAAAAMVRVLFSGLGLVAQVLRSIAALIGWPALLAIGLIALIANLEDVQAFLGRIADAMNKLFGTSITGTEVMTALAAAILAVATSLNALNAAALVLLRNPIFRQLALLFTLLETLMPGAAKKLDGALKEADAGASGAAKSIAEAKKQIEGLGTASGKASAGVLDVQRQLKEGGAAADGFAGKMIRIPPSADAAGRTVGELTEKVGELKEEVAKPLGLDPVKDFQSAWEKFQKFLKSDVNQSLKELGIEFPAKMADAFDGAVASMKGAFDGAIVIMEARAESFVTAAKGKFEELRAAAEALMNRLTQRGEPQAAQPELGGLGVPLLGQTERFPQLPERELTQDGRPLIEDRRGDELDQIEGEAAAVLEAIRTLAADVATVVAEAFEQLKTSASSVTQELVAAFTGTGDLIGTLITGAFERAAEAAGSLMEALAASIEQAVQALAASVEQIMGALQSAIDAVIASVDSAIAAVIARLEEAVRRAQELAEAAARAAAAAASAAAGGSSEGSDEGFARGGFTGHGGKFQAAGIVHRGEHVQPQNVVKQPGVLAFLELLRRSGGNLEGTIARFLRGFDSGGLVDGMARSLAPIALPGYADGGLVVPASAGAGHLGTLDLTTDFGVVRVGVTRDTMNDLRMATLRKVQARMARPPRGSEH